MANKRRADNNKLDDEIPLAEILQKLQLRRIVKENHGNTINCIAFNKDPDCKNMIAVVADNQTNIYDNEHIGDNLDLVSHYIHEIKDKPKTEFFSCCWIQEPEDSIIAVAGSCSNIYLISLTLSKVIHVLVGHKGTIFDLIVHPTEKILFSCSKDNSIRVWDLKTKECIRKYELEIASMCISPDGTSLLVGGIDGEITSLNFPKEEWVSDKMILDQSRSLVNSKTHGKVRIDCIGYLDEKRVLSKSVNGKLELWDVSDGKILKSFHLRSTGNNHCKFDFTHDRQFFGVGDGNGVMHIFNIETGTHIELKHARSKGPIRTCAFNHNSRNLVFGGDGLIWRFDYISDETLAEWKKLKS